MPPWAEALADHPAARLLGVLALALVLERSLGIGGQRVDVARRWGLGIGLWALGGLALGLLPGASALSPAAPVASWPMSLQVIVILAAADLLHYVVHRLLHAVPWLWRIHRVHHADAAFDVATSLRFHPLEALIASAPLWAAVLWMAPAPAAATLAFALISLWNALQHMQLGSAGRLERRVGPWLLTPALHRAHHARAPGTAHGNFGLMFAGWDRLCGTWTAPAGEVAVGVEGWRQGDDLLGNLFSPLR